MAGPLVRGRAALISRSTQALFSDQFYRLQTFVDDPIIVIKGTEEEIQNMINATLASWSVIGLKIAWSKGSVGYSAEWIGANISVNNEDNKVVVQVPADKINDWKESLGWSPFHKTPSFAEEIATPCWQTKLGSWFCPATETFCENAAACCIGKGGFFLFTNEFCLFQTS